MNSFCEEKKCDMGVCASFIQVMHLLIYTALEQRVHNSDLILTLCIYIHTACVCTVGITGKNFLAFNQKTADT